MKTACASAVPLLSLRWIWTSDTQIFLNLYKDLRQFGLKLPEIFYCGLIVFKHYQALLPSLPFSSEEARPMLQLQQRPRQSQ